MKILSTEIIEENGQKYEIKTFDNGAKVKIAYSDEPIDPLPEPLPTLSETDEAILNTNANVEYLVALKELEV